MIPSPLNSPVLPRRLLELTPEIAFVGPSVLPTQLLSATTSAVFHEQGFLVLPNLCDSVEVLVIRSILLRLFEQKAGRAEGNQFDMLGLDGDASTALQPQIIKPSLYAPALLRTPHFLRAQAMARQLLGPEAEFSFDHSILKRAGGHAVTPWHQDEAYGQDPYYRFDQVSIWMPLQDASEDNGCLRYIPGSHRGPLLPHHSFEDETRVQAIECPTEYFDESAAVATPMPAGWCVLHDGRTLHSALPNVSTADRLVYVLVFRGAASARSEAQPFPWLSARHTAGLERHRQWLRHGGYRVLLLRWLKHALDADLHALRARLRRLLYRCRQGSRAASRS